MEIENKDLIEQRLGVTVSITPSEEPIENKYRSVIKNKNFYVEFTANTEDRAFERSLNLWLKYDVHTPYVPLGHLIKLISSLPEEPMEEEYISNIETDFGEMIGLFVLFDGEYKLYHYGRVVKRNNLNQL